MTHFIVSFIFFRHLPYTQAASAGHKPKENNTSEKHKECTFEYDSKETPSFALIIRIFWK